MSDFATIEFTVAKGTETEREHAIELLERYSRRVAKRLDLSIQYLADEALFESEDTWRPA